MLTVVRSKLGIQVAWCLMAAGLGAVSPTSAAEPLPSYDRVRVLKHPIEISNIELRNHEDEPFSITDLSGRPVFVFFGFTNCPDVCPVTMAHMQAFYREYPDLGNQVDFVLVSVDGERDSPANFCSGFRRGRESSDSNWSDGAQSRAGPHRQLFANQGC